MKQINTLLEIAEMTQQGYTFSPQISNHKGEIDRPFKITDANGNDVTTDLTLKGKTYLFCFKIIWIKTWNIIICSNITKKVGALVLLLLI